MMRKKKNYIMYYNMSPDSDYLDTHAHTRVHNEGRCHLLRHIRSDKPYAGCVYIFLQRRDTFDTRCRLRKWMVRGPTISSAGIREQFYKCYTF